MGSADPPFVTVEQLAAIVDCCCDDSPGHCDALPAAIVEHVYASDERRWWLVDASPRFREAVTAWARHRSDRPWWMRRWPIILREVEHSHASTAALSRMVWTFEMHDLTDDSIAEDFPPHIWRATRQFAALAGLLLVLDGHVVSTQVLPVVATALLRCDRLGEWPKVTGEFDATIP